MCVTAKLWLGNTFEKIIINGNDGAGVRDFG
jgi:hypothetical protein